MFKDKNLYISRKTFLKSLAGLSLFPFLEANASLKTKSKFKRMIFVSTPFGMIPQYFKPTETGKNYKAPQVLKAIDHLRNNYTVLSNLEHLQTGNGHHNVHTFLSGINRVHTDGHPNKNQTIDQLASEYVGNQTRFPSLVLGIGSHSEKTSWSRNGIHIRPQTNVKKIFNDLFVQASVIDKKQQMALANNKESIIGVLNKQADIFKVKLSKSDTEKFGEFSNAMDVLDKNINMKRHWINTAKPKVDMDEPGPMGMDQLCPTFFDLCYWSFYTDSTRIISLEFPIGFNTADIGVEGGYHSNSHHGQSAKQLEHMAKIETFLLKNMGLFIERLAKTNDPEGEGTMLDNTMILFGSGMSSSSNHSNRDLPILLAGGDFNHGSHIRYNKPVELNNLLLTMGQKFGLPIDKFNVSTGTLEV
ncbi:MAG: DUF1552 domain-containing protein [Lentisphaerales bacterium]|nr:DUF1552 domain-containing protein [Lentisphaerales bacterium]